MFGLKSRGEDSSSSPVLSTTNVRLNLIEKARFRSPHLTSPLSFSLSFSLPCLSLVSLLSLLSLSPLPLLSLSLLILSFFLFVGLLLSMKLSLFYCFSLTLALTISSNHPNSLTISFFLSFPSFSLICRRYSFCTYTFSLTCSYFVSIFTSPPLSLTFT